MLRTFDIQIKRFRKQLAILWSTFNSWYSQGCLHSVFRFLGNDTLQTMTEKQLLLQVQSGKKNCGQTWFADKKNCDTKTVSHMPSLAQCALCCWYVRHTHKHAFAGCCYSPDLHMEIQSCTCTQEQTQSCTQMTAEGSRSSQTALVFSGMGQNVVRARLCLSVFVLCYSVLS